MITVQQFLTLWYKTFDLNVGKFSMPVPYVQAVAVVVLVFLLILSIAQFRRHEVNFSLKGAVFGIFFGFILALILEGFLLISGRTAITGLLGWKNAPQPIQLTLDAGRGQLIKVLGAQAADTSGISSENITVQGAVKLLQSLNPADSKKVKTLFCQP